ncbi:MAG: serine hydrolase domain-containing protein [Imperialibacter sp.]|uniref:serine hydrolase domain-containing protein n=1 Tax=Imperialibacter sp. TaxID=2038411 RepID=UPI0032EAEB93
MSLKFDSVFSHVTLALLCVFLISGSAIGQTPKGFEKAWKAADDYFRSSLENNRVVGGALVFVEKGKVIGSTYVGKADLTSDRNVDANTIFHWASITKTFTSIGIMQLRDRGLLQLSDPLTKYLPELRMVHNPFGSMDDITIQMVLSHSAGFRDPTWPWGGNKDWHPFEPTEWSQIVAMLPYTEILFEPGSKYSYSNPALIFLGRIIEIITGDDYEVYIDKNVLKPLGMYNSYFDVTPYHLLKYRANNYILLNGRPVANGLDFDTGITTSNGGLNAPISDMLKYLSFLTGYHDGFEVLKRSTLEELWKKQLPIAEVDGITGSIASSFFLEDFNGMQVIGHTGTQKAFYSFFYIHPGSGTACISITNTDDNSGQFDPDRFRIEASHYVFKNIFSLYK